MQENKEPLDLDVTIFENNGKKDFAQFLKGNKLKTTKAFSDFLVSLKNEANGSKETSRIIYKYISKQNITKEDEKHLKTQVYDIFKIVGIGIPFMLIPGSALLIPFLLKSAEKKGIDLYPSNFKTKK